MVDEHEEFPLEHSMVSLLLLMAQRSLKVPWLVN